MVSRVKNRHLIFGGLLLLLWAVFPSFVKAAPPQAVSLLFFRGSALDGDVRLEWQTATELSTAGFKIKRATSANGPFQLLDNVGLIPAKGASSSGADYQVIDDTAAIGQNYWYTLVEVEFNNAENDLMTVEVSLVPTATPEIIGGGETGTTDTPIPTITQAPSRTPLPTATGGAAAAATTATPRPTSQPATAAPATAPPTNTPASTPTRFIQEDTSDSLPSPTQQTEGVVEAAENPVTVAQVTETPDSYPVLEENSLEMDASEQSPAEQSEPANAYPAAIEQAGEAAAEDGTVPDGIGGRQVGSGATGDDSDVQIVEQEAEETGMGSRILLWLGFLGGLTVLFAGIVFSILLSTRRRNDSS